MGWQYKDDWDEIERALEKELQAATGRVAKNVLALSQEKVPVDTGDLKRSGKIAEPARHNSPGVASTEVQYTEEYSVYVHNGYFNVRAGRFMAPRPFLSNPLNGAEETLESEGQRAMDRAFSKARK